MPFKFNDYSRFEINNETHLETLKPFRSPDASLATPF